MKTKLYDASQIEELAACLMRHEVIAVPTDTVYGLLCPYDDEEALKTLINAKNRPEEKIFPCVVSSKEMLEEMAVLDERSRKIVRFFLPGDLTLVLPKKAHIKAVYHETPTIAFRMVDDILIQGLIERSERALVLTSANLSGYPPALNSQEVLEQLDGRIQAVVKGQSLQSQASTILDLTSPEIKVLRQGRISLEEIEEKIRRTEMKIALASDHGGVELKSTIKAYLLDKGYEVEDYGVEENASADYPDTVYPAALSVSQGKNDAGIVLCNTGIGASIVANKVKGIRAALVYDPEIAKLTREHNDSNVLALGGQVTEAETALKIVENWLSTPFSQGERHQRRINKISLVEDKHD